MKVFISWSGKTSGELARVLREWLPSVIQAVKAYYSEDDIEKGTRGNKVMAQELEDTEFGILCMTRDNLEAPWIMFEAGALSKRLDTSRVCPILFDELKKTDLKPPLTQFQAADCGKEDMRRLLMTMNKHLYESALDAKVFEAVFDKFWPDLEKKVAEVLSQSPKVTREKLRTERDLLEEVLTLTRELATDRLRERQEAATQASARGRVVYEIMDRVRRGEYADSIINDLRGQGYPSGLILELMQSAMTRIADKVLPKVAKAPSDAGDESNSE